MKFKLKKKEYKYYDFIMIPFQCDPIATCLLGIQKILTALSAVFQVIILAKFIDSISNSIIGKGAIRNSSLVWFILLIICVGWRRISFKVGAIFSKRLDVNATVSLNLEFTKKRSKLEYSQIENNKTWDLIKRVCDNPQRQVYLMLNRSYNLMLYMIRIFGVLYIIFTQVWWIGVLTALLCLPLILVSLKSGDKNYKSNKVAVQYERRHKYLSQVLSGREAASERTLFQYTDQVNQDWYKQYEIARKISWKANILLTGSTRGSSAIITLLSSFITVALIFPVANNQISIGMFIALATGMYDLVNMVGVELTKALSQLSQCKAYLKDLNDFVALPEVEGVDKRPEKEALEIECLEFKNVSFRYPQTSMDILKNISMKLEKGKHYAFVGANGAGKTTIVKLITGLYDNYTGEILINNKELRLYSQEQRKAMFSGLYQDFARYQISIRDNIIVGMDVENQEQIIEETLKSLHLYEELMLLPDHLDTTLGKLTEKGVDLSGGQWQRLAMARALVRNAPILILDEPTSALDPISESNMYSQFEEVSKRKTTIFISHRLGSTMLADYIFVLNDGAIVEEGNHESLMDYNGYYARMYTSQKGWYQ